MNAHELTRAQKARTVDVRRAGRFTLVEKLGSGATGTVWLAQDELLGRQVAVKLLHPRLASEPAVGERLRSGALATNLIRDEHVAHVLDAGCIGDSWFVSTEWMGGEPLSAHVGRPLGAAVAVPILRQLCVALQAAHQHGLVHRDLKPENVLLLSGSLERPASRAGIEARPAAEPLVKVLDFALAKVLQPKAGTSRTASGLLCGTPQYMAPEQCSGAGVDARSDLYAVGVIAYELLTGRVPFDGRNPVQVMLQQRDERPVAPCEVEPTVPRDLSDLVMRALEKRPDDRFSTAAELGEALARVRLRAALVPELPADVRLGDGTLLMRARCTQLLSGGVFLSTSEGLPALGQQVTVELKHGGLQIDCPCEVTMHVGAEQARAMGTSRGFAARFAGLAPEARVLIDRLLRGSPLPRRASEPELALFDRQRPARNGLEDHYGLLGLQSGAEASAIARRAREMKARLQDALLATSDPGSRQKLQRQIAKIDAAAGVLADTALRVEYDAARGNFRGVAMCIEAGLDPRLAEDARRRYSDAFPTSMQASRVHAAAAEAHLLRGSNAHALAECELALTLDPLSPKLHAMRSALVLAIEGEAETLSGEWRIQRHDLPRLDVVD